MKLRKRIVCLFLSALMLTATFCISASAGVNYSIGQYWTITKINNDTEFEIVSYTGPYADTNIPIAYNSLPITSIGHNSFLNNTSVEKVTFNSTIKTVGTYAFLNSTKLNTVVLDSNLTTVYMGAFSGCAKLSSINLEDTKIGAVYASTFMNTALTSVTLPETVELIGSDAFRNIPTLNYIYIPKATTSISTDAFRDTNNVVIYCYKDSAAHTFAQTNGIDFVLVDVTSYKLGDADNDGLITVLDATYIQRVLAKLTTDADGTIAVRGDISRDLLSITDATDIQRHLAGFTVPYNIGKVYNY